jgi:hypothetical protein
LNATAPNTVFDVSGKIGGGKGKDTPYFGSRKFDGAKRTRLVA